MSKQLETLRDLAIKADARLGKRSGLMLTPIQGALSDLITFGRVEVGYRSSCGCTDPTMYNYREWAKLIARAAKLGIVIHVETLKHVNAYATTKGGFWNSSIYTMEKQS